MNLIAELEQRWTQRSSTRAFRPDPIERGTLTQLFAAAQRAPSWCNVQPWHVFVTEPPVTGELAARAILAPLHGVVTLMREGARTICFVKSRRGVELAPVPRVAVVIEDDLSIEVFEPGHLVSP